MNQMVNGWQLILAEGQSKLLLLVTNVKSMMMSKSSGVKWLLFVEITMNS